MNLTAKGKYALTSLLFIATRTESKEKISLPYLANSLSLSKIYLEQIFTSLKKEHLLSSKKGKDGGYFLAKEPSEILVYDILQLFEPSLFEKTENFLNEDSKEIFETLEESLFKPFDKTIKETLSKISLKDLLDNLKKKNFETPMYFL